MFLWLYWLWAGARGAFWEPSLGRAALGGRPCLCGGEYLISDGWWAGALENLAAPFWCAEERESGEKVKIKLQTFAQMLLNENMIQMLA